MAIHTENSLRSSGVSQILDFPLAISASKTGCAESLVTSENSKVLNLFTAGATAVCAIVTYE